jgi:hypothetical protein
MTSAFSRFAGLTKMQARLVLAALGAAILCGVAISFLGAAADSGAGDRSSDLALYRAIIERLKHGGEYYASAAAELRDRHYALRPALNFRLPTLAWLLSVLPAFAGLALLRTLAAGVIVAWVMRFRQAGFKWPHALAGGAILFTGVGLAFSEAALVWHEVWAGLLVTLAIAVHGPRNWGFSVVLALCAVLIRELALPLPLIMLALAARERRHAEAAAWAGVCLAFAVALGLHLHLAAQQILPTDGANSWAAFGGWGFVLSTARWNLLLTTAPFWLNAILVPVAVTGLAGWRNPNGDLALLATTVWLAAFLALGRPDNHYWGLMYAPLLAIGCVVAPGSLLTLMRAAGLVSAQQSSMNPGATPR